MNKVFISYRRANWPFAQKLIDSLRMLLDAEIFIDHEGVDKDDFSASILNHLKACDLILLIVTQDTFASERIFTHNDWVKLEIAEALKLSKPIIIANLGNFAIPREIPDEIQGVHHKQQIPFYLEYFEAGVERLVDFIVKTTKIPNKIVLPIQSNFSLPLLEWLIVPAGKVTLHGISRKPKSYDVRPFAISKYPITNEQFDAFIDDKGYGEDQWWKGLAQRPSSKMAQWTTYEYPDHPRETVSWYEAIAFCRWLSAKIGKEILLPTETQWQFAAQGTDGRLYPWIGEFDNKKCNMQNNGFRKTTPVTKYPSGASPYGVMDMVGNVWEWCLNIYNFPITEKIGGIEVTGENPRVLRGGSWDDHKGNMDVTFRDCYSMPHERVPTAGFRVASCITFP